MKIKLSDVKASPKPIRTTWDENAINELARSIKEQGLLVPIKVRPVNGKYEIVYGHRRTEAMRRLKLNETEAIVEGIDDSTALIQAFLENIQREDMNTMDKARALKSIMEEQGWNNTREVEQAGLMSSWHANDLLALLEEPVRIQNKIANQPDTGISERHARAVRRTGLKPIERVRVIEKAEREDLSTAATEKLAQAIAAEPDPSRRSELLGQPYALLVQNEPRTTSSNSFHTANQSLSEQYHQKLLWNLARINLDGFAHFTIGYSQRNWQQIEELLALANVTKLVDARKNPTSQYKPEFSKSNLQAAAQSAGISYEHIPELGIDAKDRANLAESHDYEGLFAEYSRRVNEQVLKEVVGNLLESERIAFLCVELNPETCHRHRIALLLEEMGYPTIDL